MKPTPRPLFRALAPELVCAGALVAGLSLPARAQCGLSEFVASTTDGNDQFGAALSRDGDRLAVGAPRADESEFSAQFEGQVTVFERQGAAWVETATIDNPLAIPIDDFGRAVALNGDLLAIGAPAADSSEFVTDDGNVFLFELVGGSWTEIQRISLPAPTGVDRFGESLAWLGDELLIGAPGNDFIGIDSGVVFAYRDTGAGFQPSGVLFAPESAGGERYGTSLAASGDRVAFGGPLANGASPFAGAVEVQTFDGSSFTHALNLPSPNVGAGSFFGESVALAGDLLVVGAPGSNAAVGSAAGSAWVFDLSQPAPTATALVPVDAQPSEAFGTAVAVDGTTAVVGRPRRSIGSTALVGAVDLFEPGGGGVWVQTARLEAPTDAILPGFGEVLELDQGELLVGAPEFAFVQEGERRVRGERQYAWRSFFFRVEAEGEPRAGHEVLDVRWMTVAEIEAECRAPYHDSFRRWLREGGRYFVSAWRDSGDSA